MTAADLISDLNGRGVELAAEGDRLRYRPVDRLSPIDLENLREHKAMILRLLRSEAIVHEPPLVTSEVYATVSVPEAAVETDAEVEVVVPHIDPEPVPFDPFDRPDPNLRGLCQPPIHPRDPDRLKRVLTACDRCQSEQYVDIPIHDGQSIRCDCAKCSRFLGFPMWYGRSEDDRAERIERLLGGQLGHVVKPASKLLFDFEQASRIANGKR